jgi:hypothetical protein
MDTPDRTRRPSSEGVGRGGGGRDSYAETFKLSSVVWRLCVRKSYLEILPSGTFFPRENNPRQTSTTSKNGQFCYRTRAPPQGFFWQYLSQKSSYKTGAQTQLGVRIQRILLSRAVAYLPPLHHHRHPFGRTGGPTTKAETAARR